MHAEASLDNGPFSSHLRYYFFRLNQVPERLAAFCRLVRYRERPPVEHQYGLEGAGLTREDNGVVSPRCKLYADFFRRRLQC